MPSILELVQQHVGPDEVARISQQLGVDPTTAQQAVDAALPALAGGAANTAQQEGAGGLAGLLQSNAGVLGGLGSLIGGGAAGDAGGLLGRILGSNHAAVHDDVQQASGLGSDQTKKLLAILAPIVIGVVAKHAMSHGSADAAPQADGGQTQEPPHKMGGLLGKLMDMAESPEMRNRQ